MENSNLEIFKVSLEDTGEVVVLDGPIEVFRNQEPRIYGMPDLNDQLIRYLLLAVSVFIFAICLLVTDQMGFLIPWGGSFYYWRKAANEIERVQEEQLEHADKFLADLRNELGH